MTLGDALQGVVALFVLIGVTVMAVMGTIQGGDAVTVYGVVLGYVFGVGQGISVGRRTNGNGGG